MVDAVHRGVGDLRSVEPSRLRGAASRRQYSAGPCVCPPCVTSLIVQPPSMGASGRREERLIMQREVVPQGKSNLEVIRERADPK